MSHDLNNCWCLAGQGAADQVQWELLTQYQMVALQEEGKLGLVYCAGKPPWERWYDECVGGACVRVRVRVRVRLRVHVRV